MSGSINPNDRPRGTALAVDWSGRTDKGRVRKNNEDALSISSILETGAHMTSETGAVSDVPVQGMVFAVADGLGGQNAGEVASALAVACVPEELARFAQSPLPITCREIGDRLESAVRRTNARIRQQAVSDPKHRGMAATLSCLWVLHHRALFAQVGDSRLYRYRDGRIEQLSHDQSEVGRMVRAGAISEEESKLTVGRNVIDQALGLRDDGLTPEIDWVETWPGDLFLLCSDGLVDRLHDRDLADCITAGLAAGQPLTDISAALMLRAEESKSRDNITALLVRIASAETTEASTPPAASPGRRRTSKGVLFFTLIVGLCLGAAGAWYWLIEGPRAEWLPDWARPPQQLITPSRAGIRP